MLVVKFKLYAVAILAAIFAGGIRAASAKRKGKVPSFVDTFNYVLMTIVITGICAGIVNFFNFPVNDKTLFGYGCVFVLIGQFTDLIYLKTGERISEIISNYKSDGSIKNKD